MIYHPASRQPVDATEAEDQHKLKNFQDRVKTLAVQRCKLLQLIASNTAGVIVFSLHPGAKRVHFVTRQHNVLCQSDGVQRLPSPCDRTRKGSTKAQHDRLTMSPFVVTACVVFIAMAFGGVSFVQ